MPKVTQQEGAELEFKLRSVRRHSPHPYFTPPCSCYDDIRILCPSALLRSPQPFVYVVRGGREQGHSSSLTEAPQRADRSLATPTTPSSSPSGSALGLIRPSHVVLILPGEACSGRRPGPKQQHGPLGVTQSSRVRGPSPSVGRRTCVRSMIPARRSCLCAVPWPARVPCGLPTPLRSRGNKVEAQMHVSCFTGDLPPHPLSLKVKRSFHSVPFGG